MGKTLHVSVDHLPLCHSAVSDTADLGSAWHVMRSVTEHRARAN